VGIVVQAALAGTRLPSSQLFGLLLGIDATDPLAIISVVVLLITWEDR
jgi:hypothetical protein